MTFTAPPRLRAVDAVPFSRAGRRFVAIRDPLGVATGREPMALVLEDWLVAARFDGRAAPEEIATALATERGDAPTEARVMAIAEDFSRRFLLEDDRFHAARDSALEEFRAHSARPPCGPGVDYAPNPLELRIRIGGLVADDWDLPAPRGLVVAVAPSSGFDRFGRVYSRTYAALRHAGASFDRVLLLGACPAPVGRLLVPLDRPLDTPLGRLEVDARALAALAVHPGVDELAHRDALVLERQTLFLRLLFPRVPVVPILVGEPGPDSARDDEHLSAAVEAVRRVAALPGRMLLLVAADCSRARAGAEEQLALGRGAAREVRARDRETTEAALALDAAAYWEAARAPRPPARSENPVPLYLALELMAGGAFRAEAEVGPLRGTILGYLQAQSNTDFASAQSLVFHREPREVQGQDRT